MRNNPYLLIVIAIITFSFGFPSHSTASQSFSSGGVRVIELTTAGNDIANSIAFSPDGKWLAVGTSSGIAIFDSQTLAQEQFINTGAWARSVTFSPDGGTVAAGLFDGTARLWRFPGGQEIHVFNGHDSWVRSVAFSPDGDIFATAADDDTVRLWDSANGSLKLTMADLSGVRVLALSPDGQLLAAGLKDASIRLLNVSDGSLVNTLTGHKDWVRSLEFSPDGQTLASGAFDAKAILWDVPSGRLKHLLSDHQSSVLGLSFSPDGSTLASGSVDNTVKLWNVNDGSVIRNLVGHSDFVYDVAFSPDGKTIASGSSDNSVRFWDLTNPEAGNLPVPATPSDCRICHHPRGASAPPPVIQVKCEACHSNGIGVNFCPFFERAQEATSLPLTYIESGLPVGVPVTSQNLSVVINYPTNGETVYTASANFAPLFIAGQVNSTSSTEKVLVQLSVISAEADTPELILETHPSTDGRFTFDLTVNPHGAQPAPLQPGGPDCRVCHEEFQSQGNLPDGVVHLMVRATSLDNDTATDERWIKVDTSTSKKVSVLVLDKDSQQPVAGLPVNSSTILYEWRARYFKQSTDSQGIAQLHLETLSQATTTYQFTVPDTVLNGYYYSIVEPVTVNLAPGETLDQPITLQVQVKTSHIVGQLTGMIPAGPLEIFAIHLPDGHTAKAESDGGLFEFRNLPSGEYLLMPDPHTATQQGIRSQPVSVDLTQNPETTVTLALTSADEPVSRDIRLRDGDGNPLPFGWMISDANPTLLPDPFTGVLTCTTADSPGQTITTHVPGFYSQTQELDFTDASPLTLTFIPRPETLFLPWGTGSIVLPVDSAYTREANDFRLTRGWIWGHGNGELVTVGVAGMEVEIINGTFAIQQLPSEGGWLFLPDGEAVIQTENGLKTQVRSGEMVFLVEGAGIDPVPYDVAVFAVLNSVTEAPISANWEPGLMIQLKNRLAEIGISVAQLVTFVTYLIVFAVLVALIGRGIYWLWNEFRKPQG